MENSKTIFAYTGLLLLTLIVIAYIFIPTPLTLRDDLEACGGFPPLQYTEYKKYDPDKTMEAVEWQYKLQVQAVIDCRTKVIEHWDKQPSNH